MSEEKNFKTKDEAIKHMQEQLKENGWQKESVGRIFKTNLNDKIDLYTRARKLNEIYQKEHGTDVFFESKKETQNGDISKISPTNTTTVVQQNPVKSMLRTVPETMVSKPTMGYPKLGVTPDTRDGVLDACGLYEHSENLPSLSHAENYPSIAAIRQGRDALVIAYDSEWFYKENEKPDDFSLGERYLLSWGFALVYQDELREYMFLRKTDDYILTLEHALGRIFDDLGLPRTDVRAVQKYSSYAEYDKNKGKYVEVLFDTQKEAVARCLRPYPDGSKYLLRTSWSGIPKIPVVLLCHTGKVDVSALSQKNNLINEILKTCSEVQGGLVSKFPSNIQPESVNISNNHHAYKYNVSIQIADTMCHAPGKKKKLEDLGRAISQEKIELAAGMKEHMDKLLQKDPCLYFEYASNDSVIALLYLASLYGYNKKPPVTLTSASSKVMREIMMQYFGCESVTEFDRIYRGLVKVNHGDIPVTEKSAFIENSSLEPISDDAHQIQYFASQAFRGGCNASSEIGYFPEATMDYDLKNAYPTAMCLIPDVDWEQPIQTEIVQKELTLSHFTTPFSGYFPLAMMVGYISFEFPENVKYPCIPVTVDGIPIYPQTSKGFDGVYACGPEIYLALRLGAKIYCKRGFFINALRNNEGYNSYSLRAAVKQLVNDREKAKLECGRGSIEELTLKDMSNAGYGKVAQNVIQKQTWSAYKDVMEDMGCSAITNPVSACMITSVIRAVLMAAQNQCHELGFITPSVTTDGFISNIPENELRELDLYGFQSYLAQSRSFLTDGRSAEIWEIKHAQDDLLNFTTRGNVSLYTRENPYQLNEREFTGVCAHAGLKSGHMPDTYEDRLWLMKSIAGRTGKVTDKRMEWTGFKELVNGQKFEIRYTEVNHNMDFDMKRKPEKDSFVGRTILIDDEEYEVATFSTLPFESAEEFLLFRAAKENCKCLRTMNDWQTFWFKLDIKETNSNVKIRDMEWAVLFSCVVGHRSGLWTIPMLDELKGDARCEWLNEHNTAEKRFTDMDWKNAGRKDRQKNILHRSLIEDKLEELMAG